MRSLIIFCVIFLVSCNAALPDEKLLMDDCYSRHVKELKEKIYEKCRQDQIARADAEVDSIVHRLLNADLHDTLNFPARPTRPNRPQSIIGTVDKFDVEAKEEE